MASILVVLTATLIAFALLVLVLFFTYRTAGTNEHRGAGPRCSCRGHRSPTEHGEPMGSQRIPVHGLQRIDAHEDHPH